MLVMIWAFLIGDYAQNYWFFVFYWIKWLFQVSLSAFTFLFSEIVQYNQTQVDNIAELKWR